MFFVNVVFCKEDLNPIFLNSLCLTQTYVSSIVTFSNDSHMLVTASLSCAEFLLRFILSFTSQDFVSFVITTSCDLT